MIGQLHDSRFAVVVHPDDTQPGVVELLLIGAIEPDWSQVAAIAAAHGCELLG